MNLGKMSFLILLFLKVNIASAELNASDLTGVWLEVEQTCDHLLDDATLEKLAKGSGTSFYFFTHLELSADEYSSSHYKGSGCEPGYSIQHFSAL